MNDVPQQPSHPPHAPRGAAARTRLLAPFPFPLPRRPSSTGGAHPRIGRAIRAGLHSPSSALPGG